MFKLLYLLIFNVCGNIFPHLFMKSVSRTLLNNELDRICKLEQHTFCYYFFQTQANCISASSHVAELSLQ